MTKYNVCHMTDNKATGKIFNVLIFKNEFEFSAQSERLNTFSMLKTMQIRVPLIKSYMEVWWRREKRFHFWTVVPSRSARWQCFESCFDVIYCYIFNIQYMLQLMVHCVNISHQDTKKKNRQAQPCILIYWLNH